MDEIEMLKEKCRALEEALAAANNDAARAELRARDVVELLVRCAKYASEDRAITPGFTRLERLMEEVKHALAAAPDSDARLREVLERVTHRGIVCGESRGSAGIYDEKSRENDVKFIVDEALGVKP